MFTSDNDYQSGDSAVFHEFSPYVPWFFPFPMVWHGFKHPTFFRLVSLADTPQGPGVLERSLLET